MEIQIIFDKHQKFVAIIKNKTLQYIFCVMINIKETGNYPLDGLSHNVVVMAIYFN